MDEQQGMDLESLLVGMLSEPPPRVDPRGIYLQGVAANQARRTGIPELDVANQATMPFLMALQAPYLAQAAEQKAQGDQLKRAASIAQIMSALASASSSRARAKKTEAEMGLIDEEEQLKQARIELTKEKTRLAPLEYQRRAAQLQVSQDALNLARQKEDRLKDKAEKGDKPDVVTRRKLVARKQAYQTLDELDRSMVKLYESYGANPSSSGLDLAKAPLLAKLRPRLLQLKNVRSLAELGADPFSTQGLGPLSPAERAFVAQLNTTIGNLKAFTDEVGVISKTDEPRIINSIVDLVSPASALTQVRTKKRELRSAQRIEIEGNRTFGFSVPNSIDIAGDDDEQAAPDPVGSPLPTVQPAAALPGAPQPAAPADPNAARESLRRKLGWK